MRHNWIMTPLKQQLLELPAARQASVNPEQRPVGDLRQDRQQRHFPPAFSAG
jgi:hypothetical protein